MKVCFPIEKDEGLSSVLSGHFGSAPMFMLVDIESKNATAIANSDQHHSHGACNPLRTLEGRQIDGIVVGSIGAGALNHLTRSGIRVFRAQGATVGENADLIASNSLLEFTGQECCPGHGNGSGQAHGHGCCH
ncbi:MAG TPA: NifB/NifX family molybdenum-iron cluster-binding protein [Geobacteraceae bacterium]|nr:NifB/NifX family molybdenum-iron cluster-binding protein [Geobacteraceae bacterium]